MSEQAQGVGILDRLLAVFGQVRPGEGATVLRLFMQGLFVLQAYYMLRTAREAFILVDFDAEVRAYTQGAGVLVLLGMVFLYGVVSQRFQRLPLLRAVTAFCIAVLLIFWAIAKAGVGVSIPFYIWVGIFSLLMVSQFWVFCTDLLNVGVGQRLFPLIAVGMSAGAFLGALGAQFLASVIGVAQLVLVSCVLLVFAYLMATMAERDLPAGCGRSDHDDCHEDEVSNVDAMLSGFRTILDDRYLLWIAIFVVVLNWVNTTGEFILADFIQQHALATEADPAARGVLIAETYASFFFWVNLTGLLVQAFLVSRVFQLAGVGGAVLVAPIVVFGSYLLVLLAPVFIVIYLAKVIENGLNYSLRQTTHHALFLPTDRAATFEGKTAIDTFCWRLGDLVAAGGVYIGINLAGLTTIQFAFLNLAVASLWVLVAFALARGYRVLMVSYHRRTIELERLVHSQDQR